MSLQIFVGPMYAGKTTRLIQTYMNEPDLNKVIIDYNIQSNKTDKHEKYVYHSCMQTHDGIVAPNVYKCKHLTSLNDKENYYMFSKDSLEYYYSMYANSRHVFINECQFFPDLKKFVLSLLRFNINVYLFGLDGDFKQQLMGQTIELLPYASKIEKMKGKCSKCENFAIISHRITKDKQIYLPDERAYIPLCLSCYNY